MTRVLVIIAVAGFVLATVCFAGAAALGGRELARQGWFLPWAHDGEWDWDGDAPPGFRDRRSIDWNGPTKTRDIAWTGDDEVEIALPADVVFTQGPVAKLTVTGPAGAVDRVMLDDGRIGFEHGPRRHPWSWGRRVGYAPKEGRLQIALTAPDVRAFTLSGSPNLKIVGFDRDSLDIDLNGGGEVTGQGRVRRLDVEVHGSGNANLSDLAAEEASVDMMGSGRASITSQASAEVAIHGSGDVIGAGRAKKVEIEIFGSGDADLAGIDAEDAEVKIMGSGKAAVAPTKLADIAIFGSGDVSLATKPERLESKVAGSGKIRQREAETAAVENRTAKR